MKEYYREQVQKCEAKVALAKIGYEVKIRELATDLANAKVEVVGLIIDQLNEARDAFNTIHDELIYYQQRYQEELDKDVPAETEEGDGKD